MSSNETLKERRAGRPRTRKNFAKVQWLLGYRDALAKADTWYDEARELEARVFSISSPPITGLPAGHTTSDGKGVSVEYMDSIRDMWARADEYASIARARMEEIEEAVESLPDPIERTVIRYRYIRGYEWEMIAALCGYEHRRSVIRIQGEALEHLVIPVT